MTRMIRALPVDRPAFLKALRTYGTVAGALAVTGVARTTAYLQRKNDPAFAAAWDKVIGNPTDRLEAAVIQRAMIGVLRTKTFANGTVERSREFSDVLAMFLLKARKPEIYGDPSLAHERGTAALDRTGIIEKLEAMRERGDGDKLLAEADVAAAAIPH